jgi:prepilin-type N-terminal cleavage/methylation domain-containing protein
MFRVRQGYTLIEMMIVLVIIGTIGMLTTPRFQLVKARTDFRSAQTETGEYLAQARAVALQRGREARFVTNGNTISVTVDSSGTQVVFSRPRDLQRTYGVSLASTRAQISFDPRGMAIGNAAMERVRLSRGTMVDSICVSKLGKVIYTRCAL